MALYYCVDVQHWKFPLLCQTAICSGLWKLNLPTFTMIRQEFRVEILFDLKGKVGDLGKITKLLP
jgi:hypothetical protein